MNQDIFWIASWHPNHWTGYCCLKTVVIGCTCIIKPPAPWSPHLLPDHAVDVESELPYVWRLLFSVYFPLISIAQICDTTIFQHRPNKCFINLQKCHNPHIELAFFITVEQNFNLSSKIYPHGHTLTKLILLDDIVLPSIRYSPYSCGWPRWRSLHLLLNFNCHGIDHQSTKLSMLCCNNWDPW